MAQKEITKVNKCGINNPFYGKHHTEETKQKLRNSIGRRGQKNSQLHNERISIANKKAYSKPEVIAKLLSRPCNTKGTTEHKQRSERISKALKGIKRTPEQVQNWRKMMGQWIEENGHPCAGQKRTEEQRQRMSISHLGLQVGDKHPRWLGGKSLEPYGPGWSSSRRKIIKQRDEYTCQLCYANKDKVLDVHHIDYDKKNNTFKNLITLCHQCNAKVNIDRNFWTNYFSMIIKAKYI